jgi:hypothetical protein
MARGLQSPRRFSGFANACFPAGPQIRTVSFPRMHNVVASRTSRLKHGSDGLNRCAGQCKVVSHLVDISALSAEVRLHVDDKHNRVRGIQLAVVGPWVGIRLNVGFRFQLLPSTIPDKHRRRSTACGTHMQGLHHPWCRVMCMKIRTYRPLTKSRSAGKHYRFVERQWNEATFWSQSTITRRLSVLFPCGWTAAAAHRERRSETRRSIESDRVIQSHTAPDLRRELLNERHVIR